MRCPKCQYISFGGGSRCRNCGYEFSLTQGAPPSDLPIQSGDEPVGPLQDLPLAPLAARATQASSVDLPLFGARPVADDAPLVTPPAVPRVPLSVRKTSPVSSRTGSRQAAAPHELFDLRRQPSTARGELLSTGEPAPVPRDERVPRSLPVQRATRTLPETRTLTMASRGARMLAGMVDLLIAGAIDAAVVYFTLQLSGLTLQEAGTLPKAPLIGFLLLLNGGYFVLFTAAGGQTIGKMAAGIRVVMASEEGEPPERVSFQAALVRGIVYFLALLPAGIGLLPALFSEDGRGLHDRLAGTRVVKA